MIDTCTTHRSRVPRRSLLGFIKLNISADGHEAGAGRIAFWLMVQAQDEDWRPSGACLGLEDNPVAAPPIAHVLLMKMVHNDDPEAFGDLSRRQRGRALGAPTNGTMGLHPAPGPWSRERSSCSSFMSISAWCWAWWRPASDFTSSASGVGWAVAWWRAGFLVPGLGTSVAGFGSVGKADEEVRGQRPTICVGPTVAGRDAQKHKLKIQAWSSLVFHCRHSSFNPFEAPPWDSRPVSGAGVDHYQLLHRPRSVPTALGPAPLATTI